MGTPSTSGAGAGSRVPAAPVGPFWTGPKEHIAAPNVESEQHDGSGINKAPPAEASVGRVSLSQASADRNASVKAPLRGQGTLTSPLPPACV